MIKNSESIRLGDDVEDITAKVHGIAIGHVEYLDGSKAWLLQPQYNEDGTRVSIVEVAEAYAKRIGDGVFVDPKPELGFHVDRSKNNG